MLSCFRTRFKSLAFLLFATSSRAQQESRVGSRKGRASLEGGGKELKALLGRWRGEGGSDLFIGVE